MDQTTNTDPVMPACPKCKSADGMGVDPDCADGYKCATCGTAWKTQNGELVENATAEDAPLIHTAECAAQHFAPWMIEEPWFRQAVDAVRSGMLIPKAEGETNAEAPKEKPKYTVFNGIAIIPIAGPIMKKSSKYGGASSIETRAAIRKAVTDENVQSILLHIDSPGGTVAGTADLAGDVKAANRVKPVYAHIDDLGASAAYWVASQARRITANPTGRIGSIGTLLVLEDTSGMYAKNGIKVHVISTGKFKGAGTDGVPITDDQLKMFQEGVDDLNAHFIAGVAEGRGMSVDEVTELADGQVRIAEKAKALGLIDDVVTLDGAMLLISKENARRLLATKSPLLPAAAVPTQIEIESDIRTAATDDATTSAANATQHRSLNMADLLLKCSGEQLATLHQLVPSLADVPEDAKLNHVAQHLSAIAALDDEDAGGPAKVANLSRVDIAKSADTNRKAWKSDVSRLTADNTQLRTQVQTLSNKVIKDLDPEAHLAMRESAETKLETAVSRGAISTQTRDALRPLLLGSVEKPNTLALSRAANPVTNGKALALAVLDVLVDNRPIPLGEATGVQALSRVAPGDEATPDEKKRADAQKMLTDAANKYSPAAK